MTTVACLIKPEAGVHCTYVGMPGRGESGVTVEALAAILAALGVSLREFFRPFTKVLRPGTAVGVDLKPTMLDKARGHAEEVGARINFCQGRMEKLAADDGSIDVIISNGVINLSFRKRRVIEELYRILAPQYGAGHFVVVKQQDGTAQLHARSSLLVRHGIRRSRQMTYPGCEAKALSMTNWARCFAELRSALVVRVPAA